MLFDRFLGRVLIGTGFLLLFGAAPLAPQDPGSPRVERLVFEGAEAVRGSTLRGTVATQPTRCRSILVRPFCWVTDWSVFIDKQYLDVDELPADELRLRILYFRRGYREAQVTREVRPRDERVEVVFRIEEGAPTVLDTVEVRQTEEVLSGRQLRQAPVPRTGEELDLFQLDTLRAHFLEMLQDEGYLDAEFRDSIVLSEDGRRASLGITLAPGPRSTLREFQVTGNREIEDETIRNATVLAEGRVLRRSELRAAQRSLYESNLFHRADVVVPPQADSAKRVEITVREAPPRAAELSGGFNTVDFVQVEGRVVHYNWLGDGRRLDVRTTLGNLLAPQLNGSGIFHDILPGALTPREERSFLRPTWEASGDLTQPAFRAAENSVGVGVFSHRRVVPGVLIEDGYGAHASFTRRLRTGVSASATYRFELSGIEAGDLYFCVNHGICDPETIFVLQDRQRLSPVGISLISDQHDDPLDPTRGWRGRLELEHASAHTLSDFEYQRLSGALAGYLSLRGGRHVFAGRLRAGWVRPLGGFRRDLDPDETDAGLHPRKRFFSGGAQSVRGYGENQLGPRILTLEPDTLLFYDPECSADELAACDPAGAPVDAFWPRPLGGRAVAEANLEYRFRVWQQLQGAVFVDAGGVQGAGEGVLGRGVAAVTPGFGVRYASPVGPIRVDLGIRPTLVERLPVFTETVGEDGERRIVRLDSSRRFDPLEDTDGGAIRQVLSRLMLHLSIGQAF